MVAMSKTQHIENFCKALVEIDDFKYSYEELPGMGTRRYRTIFKFKI